MHSLLDINMIPCWFSAINISVKKLFKREQNENLNELHILGHFGILIQSWKHKLFHLNFMRENLTVAIRNSLHHSLQILA